MYNQRIRYLITALLLIAVMLFWYFKIPPFYSLSLKINDVNFFLGDRYPDQDVVFLAVDERSVNRIGRWPWDRDIFASGLEKLSAADAVVLDMVFSETSDLEKDVLLGDTIADLDNTICGFFLRNDATENLTLETKEVLSESSLERIFVRHLPFVETTFAEVNIPYILESCTLNASFSTLPDKDELYRRYPVAVIYDSLVYPSLGVQALRYVMNKDVEIEESTAGTYRLSLDERVIDIDEQGFMLLNYYPLKNYTMIPFSDVIDGKISPEYFKGKIVIVGITEAGISDIRATPLGQIPGPLLHYTFLSNYLQDIFITQYEAVDFVILLLFLLLPLLLDRFIGSINRRIALYLVAYALFFVITKVLYLRYNLWLDTFYPFVGLFLLAMVSEIFIFKLKEGESRFIKSAFSSYLSPALLKEITTHPEKLKLGGEKRDVSIIFTDIRGFTSISEAIAPEELIELLELYFTPMTRIVLENRGTMDKYIGDAIMAFYNAPVDVENHPYLVCKTALEMIRELKNVNNILADRGLPAIDIGAGINSAEVIVGNMGSEGRFEYSVIGDGVNLASRLEGLNKNYKTNIIISEFTKERLGDAFVTRCLDRVKVKGKEKAVTIYELMEDTERNRKVKELYETALEDYENKDYAKSKAGFMACYKEYGDETSNAFLLQHYHK